MATIMMMINKMNNEDNASTSALAGTVMSEAAATTSIIGTSATQQYVKYNNEISRRSKAFSINSSTTSNIDNNNNNNNKRKQQDVVLIIGAGSGIGSAIANRFAKGKQQYHICLCRRSNLKALNETISNINNQQQHQGNNTNRNPIASGYLIDITKPNTIENMINEIYEKIGPIKFCIYNIGAQFGQHNLESTSLKQFELGWKLGTYGLFRLAKCLLPKMSSSAKGGGSTALLVTSSTASIRGDYGQYIHTSAMAGRRMICQSLNAEFRTKNIHIAHIIIDGPVDSPDTLGKMIGKNKFENLKKKRQLINPNSIAETYWHLAHQPSTAWTFELDIRTSNDIPWWNSSSSNSSSSNSSSVISIRSKL